ncbi:MAG: FxLYD domain-containing protein [Syntrophomonas sp.]
MEEGKVKKPVWKKWWFWGIVIIIIIAIGSSGGDNKDQGTGTADSGKSVPVVSQKAEKPKLEVIDHSVQKEQYSTYVIGTVKNNTDKQYSYVQVEINLYDTSGAQVGSTLANANNLEPNGSWKFKAVTLEDFATYKIKDVTGY